MSRPETPPPFKPLLADDPDDPSCAWCWADNAGGHILDFGKYTGKRQRLRDTSLSYLLFCRGKCSWKPEFLVAFDKYYEGLEASIQDDYGRFIVPFGKKHRGKMIEECRDKDWFMWSQTCRALTDRYPLYFAAVQRWLDHPNHHMAIRDVGERTVDPTEYREDVEDYMTVREWYELPQPPQDEVTAAEDESSSKDESEGESEGGREDSLDILDALAEKETKKIKKAKSAETARQNQSHKRNSIASHFNAQKGVKVHTKTRRKSRHKTPESEMTLDDFVEDDGGIDSNESYYGSSASSDEDGDDSHMQGTRRITRSLAHVSATQRMGHQDVEEVSAGSVEDASEGDPPPATHSMLTRRQTRSAIRMENGSESSSEDADPSASASTQEGADDIESQSEQGEADPVEEHEQSAATSRLKGDHEVEGVSEGIDYDTSEADPPPTTHSMVTRAQGGAAAEETEDVSDQWSESPPSGSSHKQLGFFCDIGLQYQQEESEPVDGVSMLLSSDEGSVDLKAPPRNTGKRARVISSAPSPDAEKEMAHIVITPQQTRLQGVQVDTPRRGKRRASAVLSSDEEDYDPKWLRKKGKWVHVLSSASSPDAEEIETRPQHVQGPRDSPAPVPYPLSYELAQGSERTSGRSRSRGSTAAKDATPSPAGRGTMASQMRTKSSKFSRMSSST